MSSKQKRFWCKDSAEEALVALLKDIPKSFKETYCSCDFQLCLNVFSDWKTNYIDGNYIKGTRLHGIVFIFLSAHALLVATVLRLALVEALHKLKRGPVTVAIVYKWLGPTMPTLSEAALKATLLLASDKKLLNNLDYDESDSEDDDCDS